MGKSVVSWWFSHTHGWPEDADIFRWECFPKDGDTIYREYEAADHVPRFKSGLRQGQKNWAKRSGMRIGRITESEWPAVCAEYERVTGLCAKCEGDGKLVSRISRTDGASYRPCGRCNATGKAQQVEEAT